MATDQEIRDAGFKYIPQQKYLQNPFEIPTAPAPVTNQGIVNTNAFAGGNNNDGFSVYNADPNTITNMNPNRYALQDARYDNELSYVGSPITGYTTDTAAMKSMEMNPGYYGIDTIGDRFELDEKGQLVMDSEGNYIQKNQPSKAAELLSKGINLIPGMGLLKTGTAFVGDFANQFLPVNRRAIMENQLGAQGVMVNDIGQIVVAPGGSYNTPEGIMAGYNANKMTDETFTNRQDVMRETLKDKYGLTDTQVDGIISGSLSKEEMDEVNEKAYNKITGRTSDIVTNLRNIEIARNNFGNITDTTNTIFDIKTDTKNQKSGDSDGTYIGGGASLTDAGGTYDGGMHSAEGGLENTGSSGSSGIGGANEGNPGANQSEQGYGPHFAYGGLASIL
jgi:hypothetical protein